MSTLCRNFDCEDSAEASFYENAVACTSRLAENMLHVLAGFTIVSLTFRPTSII